MEFQVQCLRALSQNRLLLTHKVTATKATACVPYNPSRFLSLKFSHAFATPLASLQQIRPFLALHLFACVLLCKMQHVAVEQTRVLHVDVTVSLNQQGAITA